MASVVASQLGYALLFGLAALACFASLLRVRTISDTETRNGLAALLAASGGWAASHIGVLMAPGALLKEASYIVGLILGFSTVFAWLYFCSAYTGRTYHRKRWVRQLAVGSYLAVVAVKLTNPFHQAYFESTVVAEPFSHLAIQQQWFHWVVTGLSYSLAAIGLFMLFEMFDRADYDTRPLAALSGLTALPVLLDLVGFTTELVVNVIYAPLGVAVFAMGVLFVFEQRFLAVQFTGDVDDPVVFLDTDGHISDYNRQAGVLLPGLRDALGEPLETIPELSAALDTDQGILQLRVDEESRYYLVSRSSFDVGRSGLGTVLLFSDVTRLERQRRELERHNDQLESFATGIRHELRNALQIVGGHVEAAGEALERGNVTTARESMQTAASTADRMERTVDDLSTLAQHGQTVTEIRSVDFRDTAERTWETMGTGDLQLVIEGDGTIQANPSRLEELFESAYTFATHNEASTLTLSLTEDGLVFTDDGTRPPDHRLGDLFDYGAAVPNAKAGMAMPNVETLASVHDWSVAVDEEYTDGIRVQLSNALVTPTASTAD